MTIQKRAAMSDLPLDETALQAAAEKVWGGDGWEAAGRCYPWTPAMERAAKAYGQSLYESHLGYGERLWPIFDAAEVVPKARLQQVEADVEDLVNTLQRLLSTCEGGEYQPQRIEDGARDLLDRHGKLDVEQAKDYEGRLAQYGAELSIAREALEELDDLPDSSMWSWRPIVKRVLARLQAKDDEPIAEQMEKWDP